METITLQCWIYRDDVENIFPVEISKSTTVGVLKEIIMDKKFISFRDVEADTLRFYSIPMPGGDEHLKELKRLSLEEKSSLDPQAQVFKLWSGPDQWAEKWLIVVDGANFDMTLDYWVRGETADSIFSVKISSTWTVASLKEVIKNNNPAGFCGVDPPNLDLYKLSLPYGEDVSLEGILGARTISSLGKPLWSWQKLSAIFVPLSSDRQLHLVVDGLSLSLQCWIRGARPENSFEVQISRMASVDALKNAIKATCSESLDGVPPGHLKLYKVSEAEPREHLSALGSGRFLQGNELVGRVFNDVPFFQRPHVVVEPSTERPITTGSVTCSKYECLEDPLEANKRIRHNFATLPIQFLIPGFVTSHKREHSENPFEANKRIRHDFATLPMLTPSIIGTPSSFQVHYQQKLEPHIRCGRPNENQSPFPLVLAHRIFATFVSECETYEPSDEDLKFILKLSQFMSQFFRDEGEMRSQFRACMRDYGISLTEAKIEGTEYMTNGDARVDGLPYLISGAKDFGASKGDPYIQLAVYHLAATQSWLRVHPDDGRALPCIHIFYDGPVLGFAGSMLTEEFDVNVLGPILPLFYHRTDIDMQIRCAKMFGALKNSVTALKQYYERTTPQSLADIRFPWITRYNTIAAPTKTHEYEYLHRMDSDGLLYVCQHIHDKQRILVKFVRKYSKDAHLASAAKGGAPKLFGYHNVLSCGWSVVVMELLEGPDWVSGLKVVDTAEQRMVCDKVREHVLALHQQGFVHGDIRPQNILVKRPDTRHGHTLSVRLIDFDWAGDANKAKYPFLVNPDLGYGFERPSGVEGGGIITMEHDLAMVDLMYPYLA